MESPRPIPERREAQSPARHADPRRRRWVRWVCEYVSNGHRGHRTRGSTAFPPPPPPPSSPSPHGEAGKAETSEPSRTPPDECRGVLRASPAQPRPANTASPPTTKRRATAGGAAARRRPRTRRTHVIVELWPQWWREVSGAVVCSRFRSDPRRSPRTADQGGSAHAQTCTRPQTMAFPHQAKPARAVTHRTSRE